MVCFLDGGGRNSGLEAALMFNSSMFVLIRGNPALPLGIPECRRPRVCWAEARQEYDGRGGGSKDGGESGDCMMRLVYLPDFYISGVNSQSAKTHRSCHCLIIQTWCIYSFPTKESRLLCITNHQVWGADSRRDEMYTAQHLFKQLSLLHVPILVSWK